MPVAVLRLSGIYGPGRNAFVNLADGTARRLVKPGQVFNRIHVADIAGALWHLAERSTAGIFNVTDDLPAPPQDVVAYAAELMGDRAAAGNSVRDRPTFAHGAVLLWREQARFECGDQGRPAIASLFPTTARRSTHVGRAATGGAMAKPMRRARSIRRDGGTPAAHGSDSAGIR